MTAATRTRIVRKALADAGSSARATSTPSSHRTQMTTVDQIAPERLAKTAEYLTERLGDAATVRPCGTFISISWH